MQRSIIIFLIMMFVSGCQPAYHYRYFMLHPEKVEKIYQACNQNPSKFKDPSTCFAVERAAADIKAQIVILNLNRLHYGMEIMQAETKLAEAKQKLKQSSSQKTASDRAALEAAVERSQEKVAQLLAILLFSSEKPE